MLPATLDGYFQRILDKVHPQYRRFNARLLLMSVRHHGLSLGYVHSLWLLENDELNSRPQVAVTAGRKQPRFATTSWHPETRLRITKICSDFLTLSDGLYIEHNHRSVGDFLELPAVENELFALAEWHVESDIYLVLCQLFVSSCQDRFLCSKGANVNSVARTTFTPVADGNVDINIESSGLVNSHKSETDLRLDVVDSTEELTSRTIWELYLQECDFKGRHFQNYEPDAVALTQILIESGADLECRIPDDCESIQQAIAKRLEADKLELGLDTEMEPILNALSKRGYGV
jgi:hypothetical protein